MFAWRSVLVVTGFLWTVKELRSTVAQPSLFVTIPSTRANTFSIRLVQVFGISRTHDILARITVIAYTARAALLVAPFCALSKRTHATIRTGAHALGRITRTRLWESFKVERSEHRLELDQVLEVLTALGGADAICLSDCLAAVFLLGACRLSRFLTVPGLFVASIELKDVMPIQLHDSAHLYLFDVIGMHYIPHVPRLFVIFEQVGIVARLICCLRISSLIENLNQNLHNAL
jgi:hypothetical protein